jgi:hypothetical protein
MPAPELYEASIDEWNKHNQANYGVSQEGGFVHFKLKDALDIDPDSDLPPPAPVLKRASDNKGYKFHISLGVDDNNLYEGWKVVLPILAKYGIKHFKIAPDGFDELNKEQRGKEITVYSFENPDIPKETWAQLLEAITYELAVQNIKPGPFPNNPDRKDEKIPGSDYISYRNDNWRVDIQTDPDNIFKEVDLTSISLQAKITTLEAEIADLEVEKPALKAEPSAPEASKGVMAKFKEGVKDTTPTDDGAPTPGVR